ncbi:uncharacterized protein LOC143028169 [Oratosquilla oratoria]|uniref:uncharacterized protein LOC143028169 n=1 Tax=Oratosquilla oratoria TaxID=337810 RepID=UPI003F75F5FA
MKVTMCTRFSQKVEENENFLNNVWFSDEAHFLLCGGARQPLSAVNVGDGNYDNKSTGSRGSSAMVGNSPRRRKLRRQIYDPRTSLSPPQRARPWQMNLAFKGRGQTMFDKADSSCPERCSALIAHELCRLKVDIAALSEVRLADEGSLKEHGAGYTLFWSGKPSTEKHLSGVGLMVRNSIASKLETLPTGHSDHIMSMLLPLLLYNTPADVKILILGYFNARVGGTPKPGKESLEDTALATLNPKPKTKNNPVKKLNIDSLFREVKTKFQVDLQQKLDESPCTDPTPNTLWENLKSAILKTYEEVLGYTKKENKDWYENDKEIQDLLAKKRAAHQAHLAQPTCLVKNVSFRRACSTLQRKPREIQNERWDSLMRKTQLCADRGDYGGFYEALKAAYGPTHQVQIPLRSSDGQDLLTDKTSILTRWSEQFQTILSSDRTVQDSAIQCVLQFSSKEELDVPPTLEETTEAIELKSRKAAGVDGIPPEIWKHEGPTLHDKLHKLLVSC